MTERLRRLSLLRGGRPLFGGPVRGRAAGGGPLRAGASSLQAAAQRVHDVDDLRALLLFLFLGHDGLAVRFRLDPVEQTLAVLVLVAQRIELLLRQLADE